MKTKNTFTIIGILMLFIQCKAQQQVFPLTVNMFEIPENSYMKDMNYDLDKFTGTWKASFEGKNYYLYITKENYKYKDAQKIYQDVLNVKYTVKTSDDLLVINENTNQYLQSTSDYHSIYSGKIKNNGDLVALYYGGTNCGVGYGIIQLTMLNSTQFNWRYGPNSSSLTEESCPLGQDLKIYLPITTNLVFTKQ